VQEFLAATIGGYRDFIKSPSQHMPARISSATSRLSGGMSKLRARLVQTMQEGGMNTQEAPETGFMDDHVILGTNGYRFYHSAFVASFGNQPSRKFVAELIHTQLWQVLADLFGFTSSLPVEHVALRSGLLACGSLAL
jgi:hypothetical protein